MSDEIGYDGALCCECWSPLNRSGYCTSGRCPHQDYLQDEAIPDSVRRKLERVVGNSLSKKCYAWGTRGYKRAMKSLHREVFASSVEAERAGYECMEE